MQRGHIYDDVSHEAATPRSLKNPRIHLPEMMGNVKLSSNDPRSRRFINISGNMNFNQGRSIPSASATPLMRPAATKITNKPRAPVLVGLPPIIRLAMPRDILTSVADGRDETPKSESGGGAVKPARDLRGASGRCRKGRREGCLRVLER